MSARRDRGGKRSLRACAPSLGLSRGTLRSSPPLLVSRLFSPRASSPLLALPPRVSHLAVRRPTRASFSPSRQRSFSVAAAAVKAKEVALPPTQLLINGKFVNSVSGKTFETINPVTGTSSRFLTALVLQHREKGLTQEGLE
jgi:hypothetical protein